MATVAPEKFRRAVPLAVGVLKGQRAPQAADDPTSLAWAEQHATLVLAEGRIPFDPYPYQRDILDDRSPRRLILKARQTGISNTVAIEALHAALTTPDSTTLFVSRNQDLAQELIRYCQHTMGGLQIAMPALVKENQGLLEWANGARIISLPATPSTGRGVAAQRVYLDEFAFCLYDQLIYESIVPTLSHGGQLTVLSTPKGRANMFFRLWSGLEGGAWSRHEIHWQDCPRYTPEWAEAMRATMTRQAWAQEYDCDFVASGDAVFDAADLARCGVGYDGDVGTCERFVTAWDIGRRQDHTVGITLGLRADTWHVVAFERFLEPYPVIQMRIEQRTRQFRGEHWMETNGIGDPVRENLTVSIEGFTTTAKTKTQAIQALQLLVQQGRFRHDEPQLGREMSLYQWNDENLVTDSVIAAAIAAHATSQGEAGIWFLS